MWKTPVGKEAKAPSQPAEGRPSAPRMRQVPCTQPKEEPQGSLSQASARHSIKMPRVPYPQSFRPVITQQAQMGSQGHRLVLSRTSVATQVQMLPLPVQPPPRSERPVSSYCRRPTVARSQEPPQQPAARQEPQHGRAAGASTRTDTVQAAKSSKAPDAQPTLRNTGGSAKHLPAMPVMGSKGSVNARSLGLHQKVFPQRLPPLPNKTNPTEPPKGSCLPATAMKKLAPLPPVAPARASHGFGKREAPAKGQRQAPVPQSARRFKAALPVTHTRKERKPLLPPLAVPQKTKKRQVAPRDITKSLHVAKVAMPPATLESLGAAKHQGEHSRTLASPAVDEGKDAAAPTEISGAEAVTPHLAPSAHEGRAATSPFPQDAQHPVTEARAGGTTDTEVQEAGSVSLGLHVGERFRVLPLTEERRASLNGQLDGPEDRELQHRQEEMRTGKDQEEEDQEREADKELSQLQDATNCDIWIKALVLELFQPPDVDPLKGKDDEGEAAASPMTHDSERQEEPATLANQQKEKEKAESENDSHKELSHGEAVTVRDIYDNPSVPELPQARHAGPQEGSSIPSSVGTVVTGEAAEEVAGDLQSLSPAPARPTDTEPAAPCLPGAAEQEQHRTPLAAVAQGEEEALAPASPGFDEQQAAAQAQRRAPVSQSLAVRDAALQVTSAPTECEPMVQRVAVVQGTDQQPLEHRHTTQRLDVVAATITPAARRDSGSRGAADPRRQPSTAPLVAAAGEGVQDMVSPAWGEQQEEASSAVASSAADKGEAKSSLTEVPKAEAVTPRLAPEADTEGHAAAPPSDQDSQHPGTQAPVLGTPGLEVQEAGASPRLRVAGRFLVIPWTESLEGQKRSSMASSRHSLDRQRIASLHEQPGGPEEREFQLQDSQGQPSSLRHRGTLRHRQEELPTEKEQEEENDHEREEDSDKELSQLQDVTNCNIWIRALIKEVKESSECDLDKELSQGEAITIGDIYVNPSVPELSKAPHAVPQEGSSIPSSMGTAAAQEAAEEAVGDLQSLSPAPTGPAGTEPAAPCLPGAAELEQLRTPLATVAQEEEAALAPAPASPGSASYDAQHAAPQAPAPRQRTLVDRALQVSFLRKVPSRASVKHQGEASTAVASPAAQEEERAVSPAAVQDTKDEPGTATHPDAGALQNRQSSHFRRALQSLHKTSSFSCMNPQEEE